LLNDLKQERSEEKSNIQRLKEAIRQKNREIHKLKQKQSSLNAKIP
jgi:SMC interacting uncharacterized protein involved in chromosome segregation